MMIECPRCGFAQPKDQYCASCGVNMDQLLAKPKPFMVRLLQNPNFHLSLIGLLIVMVVGWIFYTQSSVVSRQVSRMLDLPVSSKDAGDADQAAEAENTAAAQAVDEEMSAEAPLDPPAPPPGAAATAIGDSRSPEEILALAVGASVPGKAGDVTKIEAISFEVPRESLAPLLQNAQRLGEGSAGRAYYIAQGTKALETFQTVGQPLGLARSTVLSASAQLAQNTAATAPEMFQISLSVQVTKWDNKQAGVNYAMNFVLPQPEPAGQSGPAMRQVMEVNLLGQGNLAGAGLMVLLFDPPNRSPRDEWVAKSGEGPWGVFTSPEFRSGATDWVMLIHLK